MIGTRIIVLLAFGAAIAACSTGPANEQGGVAEPLSGAWKVAQLDSRSVEGPTLQFATDGGASGSTGCNRFSTSANSDGRGGLSFAPTAVTKMACLDGDRMKVESAFLDALSKTVGHRRVDGRLQLTDVDGRVLVELEPAPADP